MFYRLLMTEMLFVCGQVRRAAATHPALPPQPGDQLSLAVVRHNGRSYHPVFSSLARLVGFAGKDVPYFSMAGRELFRCTPNVDFALNPNSPFGKELTAREIAFWLDPSARARRTLANNPPRAILSAPDACPRQLTDAFRILFANRSDVVAAHLLYVAFTDRDEPAHPLIGIGRKGNGRSSPPRSANWRPRSSPTRSSIWSGLVRPRIGPAFPQNWKKPRPFMCAKHCLPPGARAHERAAALLSASLTSGSAIAPPL